VCKNRVLRRLLGTKRGEIIRDWRKLHNEYLHNLHTSLDIIRMIKLRMRWAGHAARMGEECIERFGGESRRKQITTKT
jgi:hypothetical protein